MPSDYLFPGSDIETVPLMVFQVIASFFVACCVLALAIVAREKYQGQKPQSTLIHPQTIALENFGEDSVYRFYRKEQDGLVLCHRLL